LKLIIEGPGELRVEDGGQAQILTVYGDPDVDEGVFVRIQSWSEARQHSEMEGLVGKKLRITIEAI